ncbi:MAG: GNAT family N-acetyltransferase [Burkholderiaceae bacterium]
MTSGDDHPWRARTSGRNPAPIDTDESISLRCGDWAALRARAAPIRTEVFIVEQQVPADLEWDEADEGALHCVAFCSGDPLATGRLLPDGWIGRLAVRTHWRGRGIGGLILERLVAIAFERGHAEVWLSAQCHAEPFYRAHGFEAVGEVYDEVRIPHRQMCRRRH